MVDIDKALLDPAGVFDTPQNVVSAEGLTREQKIEILRRWEYDARELEVATEENMPGSGPSSLQDVMDALNQLGYDPDMENEPPTKQGGA